VAEDVRSQGRDPGDRRRHEVSLTLKKTKVYLFWEGEQRGGRGKTGSSSLEGKEGIQWGGASFKRSVRSIKRRLVRKKIKSLKRSRRGGMRGGIQHKAR